MNGRRSLGNMRKKSKVQVGAKMYCFYTFFPQANARQSISFDCVATMLNYMIFGNKEVVECKLRIV